MDVWLLFLVVDPRTSQVGNKKIMRLFNIIVIGIKVGIIRVALARSMREVPIRYRIDERMVYIAQFLCPLPLPRPHGSLLLFIIILDRLGETTMEHGHKSILQHSYCCFSFLLTS